MRVAEEYAAEWLTKAEVKPPCSCDNIELPPTIVDMTGVDPRGIPYR